MKPAITTRSERASRHERKIVSLQPSTDCPPGGSSPPASDWDAVLAEADGQSVNWYMYGGDDALNAFVEDEVAPRLAALGVRLNQVRITDTAEAAERVLDRMKRFEA